jgi:hypothetical protein
LVRKGWKFVDCFWCGIGINKDNILLVRVRRRRGEEEEKIFLFLTKRNL